MAIPGTTQALIAAFALLVYASEESGTDWEKANTLEQWHRRQRRVWSATS
jgi:hypothetical protein